MSLDAFIGEWKFEGVDGSCTFEWTLDHSFVLQRSWVDVPGAPEGLMVIAEAGDAYRQHYFDTRGVVRLYDMTFDGKLWTLSRSRSDFSELSFHQRFFGDFSADGKRIDGRWEISHDEGKTWELDFPLIYYRR